MKEFKIWLIYTKNAFQQILSNRPMIIIFMAGKILRIVMFLVFLSFLFKGAGGIAGYSREQIIFFYLSFNLIDTASQMLFREVYRFRALVIDGNLDFVLLKPLNPLIRVLLGGGDMMDLLVLIVLTAATVWFGASFITLNFGQWLFYVLMLANGLLIAAALHILVLGIGIVTTAVDHLIMIYRDFTSMFRIPVDLYVEPIRALLTFAIPLGIMMTFPAKALMGILSAEFAVLSVVIAAFLFALSLFFWNWSLKKYQSASS